jgi:hypothetical protein
MMMPLTVAKIVHIKGDHFRFGFYQKKITKPIFFKKTEISSNRPVFGLVFQDETGSNRFCSVFSGLSRFFSVWVGSVFSVLGL